MEYYAVFTKTSNAIKVEFPDIKGCFAYGFDLAEAYEMAFDKLFRLLPSARIEDIISPSTYEDLKTKFPKENQLILPFQVDLDRILASKGA